MMSAFGVDHLVEIAKASYYAAAKGVTGVGREAVGRARTPKLVKLEQHESRGRAARIADQKAKASGAAGADIHSRPRRGAGRQAWERGWNA